MSFTAGDYMTDHISSTFMGSEYHRTFWGTCKCIF